MKKLGVIFLILIGLSVNAQDKRAKDLLECDDRQSFDDGIYSRHEGHVAR